jgi:hypothetical protein
MNKILKTLLAIVLLSFLAVSLYILFLWATYIDNTVTQGSKYGFTIGSSVQQTYEDILSAQAQYPKLMLYISYGPRAGDNMTVEPTRENFNTALKSYHWELLLDGEGEFFNGIRLRIAGN